MINLIKNYIYILNIVILLSFIIFIILFYFEVKINFISNFLLLISISTLCFKILYWHLIKRTIAVTKHISQSSLFLLRLAFCIFVYISPAYFIIQEPNLVMSKSIILITLVIISMLIFIGLIIDKYISLMESGSIFKIFYEKQ